MRRSRWSVRRRAAESAVSRGFGRLDDGSVVGGDRFGHPSRERTLLGGGAGTADPECGLTVGLDHLLCGPLELLACLSVRWEGDKPVEQLYDAQALSRRQSAIRGVEGSRGSR